MIPIDYLIIPYGAACFILGALFTTWAIPYARHALARRKLRAAAYAEASKSMARWNFEPWQCHAFATAVADRFAERIAEAGLEEAWREFAAWSRTCEETNNLLRLPEQAALEKIEETMQARFGGRVVKWDPARRRRS